MRISNRKILEGEMNKGMGKDGIDEGLRSVVVGEGAIGSCRRQVQAWIEFFEL